MAKYLHTMYRIVDPERSRAFYEALGFEFRRDLPIVRNGECAGRGEAAAGRSPAVRELADRLYVLNPFGAIGNERRRIPVVSQMALER